MVFLPNARAGCVIEISYRTQALLNSSLPHVSEVLPVQRDVPGAPDLARGAGAR